jgi:hypothetical protein
MATITKDTSSSNNQDIDIFLTAENFEDTMNGLIGVYYRLFAKESKKTGARDQEKVKQFFFNYEKYIGIKRELSPTDWVAMNTAIQQYNQELKEMVALELSKYATI